MYRDTACLTCFPVGGDRSWGVLLSFRVQLSSRTLQMNLCTEWGCGSSWKQTEVERGPYSVTLLSDTGPEGMQTVVCRKQQCLLAARPDAACLSPGCVWTHPSLPQGFCGCPASTVFASFRGLGLGFAPRKLVPAVSGRCPCIR